MSDHGAWCGICGASREESEASCPLDDGGGDGDSFELDSCLALQLNEEGVSPEWASARLQVLVSP